MILGSRCVRACSLFGSCCFLGRSVPGRCDSGRAFIWVWESRGLFVPGLVTSPRWVFLAFAGASCVADLWVDDGSFACRWKIGRWMSHAWSRASIGWVWFLCFSICMCVVWFFDFLGPWFRLVVVCLGWVVGSFHFLTVGCVMCLDFCSGTLDLFFRKTGSTSKDSLFRLMIRDDYRKVVWILLELMIGSLWLHTWKWKCGNLACSFFFAHDLLPCGELQCHGQDTKSIIVQNISCRTNPTRETLGRLIHLWK